MGLLPAICENCSTVFPGFSWTGGVTITMTGSKAGPCPNCGGMGRIPDGTFRIIENFIHVLSAPERTVDELMRFSKVLRKTQENKITPSEMEDEVIKETPQLSMLLDLLPKTRDEKRSDLQFFITTILAIIAIVISLQNDNEDKSQHTKIEVEQVINNIYQNQSYYKVYEEQSNRKIGRNEQCPCGSGIKYKRCHGRPIEVGT